MIKACLIILSLILASIPIYLSSVSDSEAAFIRNKASQLLDSGLTVDTIDYLLNLEKKHGNLIFDNTPPSLYSILGVALYSTQRVDEAIIAFTKATKQHPSEARAWINLGEIQVQTFALTDALKSFQEAFRLDCISSVPRILRTMGWSADWRNMEFYTAELELHAKDCTDIQNLSKCVLDSSSGMEYSDADRNAFVVLEQITPNARGPPNPLFATEIAGLWPTNYVHKRMQTRANRRRLKVGLVSSDFGVHPVSSLIRGLIQFINRDRIELFCFSLQSRSSWWGMNISQSVEHFINIPAMNQRSAASFIAKYNIEVLIDLNGHTMFSGLPIMSYRPSPLQMTFLGLPTTTGATFIDYFIGDYVATPPELQSQFVEKLLLMPPSYIVNDYAQMQGGVISSPTRAKRSCLNTNTPNTTLDIETASVLLATLSNSQKMSPEIFHVWMNILSALGGSQFVIMDYKGSDTFFPNLRNSAAFYGIRPERLKKSLQQGWIDHLTCKTTLDLLLDTTAKNGHTTGLDGIWSGVPSLTLGGGDQAPARAGESMFSAMEMELGVIYSLKEYEDMIYRLFHNKKQKNHKNSDRTNNLKLDVQSRKRRVLYNESRLLLKWREEIHHKRTHSTLFDTRLWARYFERFLEAAWEIHHFSAKRGLSQTFHIFPEREYVHKQQVERTKKRIVVDAPFVASTTSTSSSPNAAANDSNYVAIPAYVFDGRSIMLNIGGIRNAKGWFVVNNKHSNYNSQVKVDILRDMHNLYGLPDNSVAAVYCSHTLEHNSHSSGKVEAALKEWYRVLRPGGLLMVAVPDLAVLSRMYLDPSFTTFDRYRVMNMIYGGQFDEGDFHHIGFDQETLAAKMQEAGFCEIERVSAFNLAFTDPNPPYDTFSDSSEGVYKGYFISLNLVAKVCPHSKANTGIVYDGFEVKHAALPYLGFNQSAYMYN